MRLGIGAFSISPSRTAHAVTASVVFSVFLTSPLRAGTEAPQATLSAGELREQILKNQDRIRSVRVRYQSDDYPSPPFPTGTYLHREVAVRAPDSLRHLSAHGHRAMHWRDDYHQQVAYLVGDQLYNTFPVNRTFFTQTIPKGGPLPGTLPGEFFFIATGIWPLTGREPPKPDGRPYVLRAVAGSTEYSLVRSNLELLDGRWCHVLEYPDYDTLWIDVERGCALMARETRSRLNGALVQRIELTDHREAAPGVWMPGKMRNLQFDYLAGDPRRRRRVVRDATHVVTESGVNDVPDSAFVYVVPAGSLKRDGAVTSQASPGGLEHLDEVVKWIRRNDLGETNKSSLVWPNGWRSIALFLPAGVIAASAELLLRVRRRLARRGAFADDVFGGRDSSTDRHRTDHTPRRRTVI